MNASGFMDRFRKRWRKVPVVYLAPSINDQYTIVALRRGKHERSGWGYIWDASRPI